MFKWFLALGAINAFLSVALGAFGAHGLKGKIAADLLEIYETGVQYHMMHALGLIVAAFAADKLGNSLPVWSGWLFLAGIVLFSGSLYTLALTNIRMLGMITPFGGVAFLAGWLLLFLAALKSAS